METRQRLSNLQASTARERAVFLYGGRGKYIGAGPRVIWDSPPVGGVHAFILFLAQAEREADRAVAIAQARRFGFSDLELGIGKPLDVEALNVPQMRGFQKHYEDALSEGVSLVWYP